MAQQFRGGRSRGQSSFQRRNHGVGGRRGFKGKNARNGATDSRVADTRVRQPDTPEPESHEASEEDDGAESDEEDVAQSTTKPYGALLELFNQTTHPEERQAKRRKVAIEEEPVAEELEEADEESGSDVEDGAEVAGDAEEEEEVPEQEAGPIDDDEEDDSDPFQTHFEPSNVGDLARKIKAASGAQWRTSKQQIHGMIRTTSCVGEEATVNQRSFKSWKDVKLKKRLSDAVESSNMDATVQSLGSTVFSYQDLLYGSRTVENAGSLRRMACLHSLNHIYKGRDRILKNNERLARSEDSGDLELRDQGFTRPKVLVLLETRQACFRYIEALMDLCKPDQQENKKRFQDQFAGSEDKFSGDMPEDFKELFEGNDDNDFRLGLKFTRKTVKYFSGFYASDMILASPLGLRRIIEHEDPKKADSDFLSSIEIAIVDQTDAMLMQNWEHVEFVFSHLNLQPKDAHGCDFSRVRNWYLDGHAKHLRQTILFSAFITPELNRLYNTAMLNAPSGKTKVSPSYAGAILSISPLSIRQTFSRYDSPTPSLDPDARFAYFTSAILPSLTRTPLNPSTPQGILLFIPSYLDFVRLRNHFAASSQTEHVSFGAISEYSDVSDARRARSHFVSGKHSILLYTGRAHHFHRYRIKGVKRVVMYGVPENPTFYTEIVAGFLGDSVGAGKVEESECSVRAVFSRWDGLRLERVVGSGRVAGMLREKGGDTFDFV